MKKNTGTSMYFSKTDLQMFEMKPKKWRLKYIRLENLPKNDSYVYVFTWQIYLLSFFHLNQLGNR